MTTRQTQIKEAIRELIAILNRAEDTNRQELAYLLLNRLTIPQAYITIVGETSTGKSSLVNALLAQEILPVSAKPTTGTVTHVVCRDELEPLYFAIYKNATQESINRSHFLSLNIDPTEELLRLQVRIQPRILTNLGLHVFDTPGYNSILSQHEEILQQFLPQSDVIVFVVGYRSGFGQNDQNLLEAVVAATSQDKSIPIILVINRTPLGIGFDDRRVAEIIRLAKDGLGRQPLPLLISSATAVADTSLSIQARPNADRLWNTVHKIATDPQRLEVVQAKLEQQALMLLDETDEVAAREESYLMADVNQEKDIADAIRIAKDAHAKSLAAIEHTMANLEISLSQIIEKSASVLKSVVEKEILASDKWLGYAECMEWVCNHVLPFEIRNIGRVMEDYMATELDALNRTLEEIANTAIAGLNQKAHLRGHDPAARFAISLATTLTHRIAGYTVNSVLRGMGGVGGTAAGAGNLVKMAVSRVGKLFGKTFSREIYNQIGRIFTKKMLQRLTIAIQIATEIVGYLYHVKVWRDKFITQCYEAIDNWINDVKKDLISGQIRDMRLANYQIIDEIYSDISDVNQIQLAKVSEERANRLQEVLTRRRKITELRRSILFSHSPH